MLGFQQVALPHLRYAKLGSYIGLEAAAVLAQMHKKVTVSEALNRVLARVTGEAVSRFYKGEHRVRGVHIRLSAQVECIEGRDGKVAAVRLANGKILDAAMVIAGIGITQVKS